VEWAEHCAVAGQLGCIADAGLEHGQHVLEQYYVAVHGELDVAEQRFQC